MSSAPVTCKQPDSVRSIWSAPSIPWNRYAVFLTLAIAGCAIDLATKSSMFGWLGLPNSPNNLHWVIKDYVGIQTAVNQGALFGMGQGMSAWFAGLSIVAALAIIYWLFVTGAAKEWMLTISLGCVMGGIFGNLYDRLGFWHGSDVADRFRNGVRDWILLCYGNYTWPNFNIADTLLVVGAFLLVVHAIFEGKPVEEKSESPAAE